MHFYWHTLYSPTCIYVCVFYFYFDCFYFFFTGLLFFVCLFCFVCFFCLSVCLFDSCCYCCCCCQCCVYPHYKLGHSHRKLIIVCPLSRHVPRTCRKSFLLSTHPAYNIYLHSIFTLSNVLVADICLLSNHSVNFSHQSIINHSKTKYWDTFVACRSETCAIQKTVSDLHCVPLWND